MWPKNTTISCSYTKILLQGSPRTQNPEFRRSDQSLLEHSRILFTFYREGEATNTLILNVTSKEPSKKPQKNEPPIIVKQLTPTVCKLGDSVKLETVITGTPTPKIEWSHNGTNISTTATMKMTEKDTIYSLVIDNVDQTFDGNYTVKAVNSSGSVQTSANLTVEGTSFFK